MVCGTAWDGMDVPLARTYHHPKQCRAAERSAAVPLLGVVEDVFEMANRFNSKQGWCGHRWMVDVPLARTPSQAVSRCRTIGRGPTAWSCGGRFEMANRFNSKQGWCVALLGMEWTFHWHGRTTIPSSVALPNDRPRSHCLELWRTCLKWPIDSTPSSGTQRRVGSWRFFIQASLRRRDRSPAR